MTPEDRIKFMREADDAIDSNNVERALEIYRLLCSAHCPEGLVALAGLYEEGRGVQQDANEAQRLFEEAARNGDSWGLYSLAAFYDRSEKLVEARTLLERLVGNSYLPALNRLADFLDDGLGGPEDPERALQLRQQAAAAGHIWALHSLSRKYICVHFGQLKRIRDLELAIRGLLVCIVAGDTIPRDLRRIP